MDDDAGAGLADQFADEAHASVKGRVRTSVPHQQLLEHLPAPPVAVLDVGGGAGHQAFPLAQAGYDVTLLDPSPAMLDKAQRRLQRLAAEAQRRVTLRLDALGPILRGMTGNQPPATGRVSSGPTGAIRPMAAAVVRKGDRILVWDDHDPATGKVVAVPLAGGIEFGETGAQAVARELKEEIGATATAVRYLGLLEDVFDWNGQRRHEVYLVYDVELADREVYDADEVVVTEDDGSSYPARWRALGEFAGPARLVPDGLLDLISDPTAGRPGAQVGPHPYRVASQQEPTAARFAAIFAPDVVFRSPVAAEPLQGVALVAAIQEEAHRCFGPPRYRFEHRQGAETLLAFDAELEGDLLQAAVLLRDDPGGRVAELVVMMRPLPVVKAFGRIMAERLGLDLDA